MKRILLLILFIFSVTIFSQNDCSEAITVCGNSGYNDLSATGIGKQELSFGVNNCSSEETNSLWFKLNIKKGGTLGFTLTPNSKSIEEDFDFFIFGPNATCNNLGFAIRCSTTNPEASGQSDNLTGMNDKETETSEGPGENGNSFVKWLTVKAGESYFLVVDRPIGNSNFTLDWTGTASFSEPPTINISETINSTLNLEECDGNNDEKAVFNLSVNNIVSKDKISTITYHTSSNDATLGINPIATPTNYTNTSNPQTLYIRLTNKVTKCFTIADFTLTVKENIKATKPNDYEVCDNISSGSDSDGISNTFLLKTKDAEILNRLKFSNYKVSYYTSLSDAEASTNSIDKNRNYTNTINEQTIYIRLESLKDPECFDASQSFKLVVNALPNINKLVELKQCDDDTDGKTKFNLKEAERLISNNYKELNFTYYTSEIGAKNEDTTQKIKTVIDYANTQVSGESVWANVKNKNGCFRITEIKLTVSTTQVPSGFIINYNECDDLDLLNNTDGITSFDISNAIQKIKNLFPTNQSLEVSLYETQNDALAETNKITNLSSYRNKISNEQFLFVRVDNNLNNSCLGLGKYIRLTVNSLPDFTVNTPQFICLKSTKLSLEAENPNGNYTYQWTKNNAKINSNTTPTLSVINGGTYEITALNTVTNCFRTKKIVVNESIKPAVSASDISVKDERENNSITINTTNLGIGDYEFALQNESQKVVKNYQDTPVFKNLEGGIYTVLVRDKNGCGQAKIEVPVVEYPGFFTPNNDGNNDIWKVKGVNDAYFSESSIRIFNRFGKLLRILKSANVGWDGFYNGKLLPPNDYWFSITLVDNKGIVRKKTGHFSLLWK